uniref:Uncharacterized protein n=1 Tax=uncultured Desulfobacterium sp. TaxID=201089 RepID=E1YC41_9BACT|nr:hypothetical protein N47_G34590 [uncultured Desulfobacterium sp.]
MRYHEWRHLNFFQHEAYLTARVPRVDCGDCGIKTVEVPWARSGSGFTLLFEALIIWKHILAILLISGRFVATCPQPS